MRIGQLANSGDVSVETVRYYQSIGLLGTPKKPIRGFRSYRQADVARLRFIRRAQQLGFSLEEIQNLVRLSAANCKDVQALTKHKLGLIREKISDLNRMEQVLVDVLRQCVRRKTHKGCPIIESLSENAPTPPRSHSRNR